MKITKRQLKRIIREEYSRLKKHGLIQEHNWSGSMSVPVVEDTAEAYDLGYQDGIEGRDQYQDIYELVDSGKWSPEMLMAWEEGFEAGREESLGSTSDFDY